MQRWSSRELGAQAVAASVADDKCASVEMMEHGSTQSRLLALGRHQAKSPVRSLSGEKRTSLKPAKTTRMTHFRHLWSPVSVNGCSSRRCGGSHGKLQIAAISVIFAF